MNKIIAVIAVLLFVFLVSIALPSSLPSKEIDGFLDMKWGDPVEKLGELDRFDGGRDSSMMAVRKDEKLPKELAGIFPEWHFQNNGLYMVKIICQDDSSFEALKRYLTKHFGEPKAEKEHFCAEALNWYAKGLAQSCKQKGIKMVIIKKSVI